MKKATADRKRRQEAALKYAVSKGMLHARTPLGFQMPMDKVKWQHLPEKMKQKVTEFYRQNGGR